MRTPGALAIAVLAIGGTLTGCAGSGGGGGGGTPPKPACKPPATPSVSFSMTIQPIFNRSCALVSCHSGAVPAQGQDLSPGVAYGQLVNVASTEQPRLERVKPHFPKDSYLVRKRPGYVGDMTRVMASRWEWSAIQQLPDAVRKGGTVMPEHAETPQYEYWEDFAAHATAVAKPTAELTAEVMAHWASGRRRLDILDVACGHGLYGFTLARQHPQAHVWSLDWPNVLPIAHGHAVQMGVADRVSTIGGDMFTIPLGGPYDVVMVTNVLHHFSEQRATELLRRLSAVLCSGGRLIVVGFTVGDGPAAMDPAPHLFSILMLVWTTQGEVHSMAAYERMMAGAGLLLSNAYDVPGLPLHVMIADKP